MKKIISFDRKNLISGFLMGIVAMLLCFSWESGKILGVPFAFAFCIVGAVKINIRNRPAVIGLNLLWSIACVYLTLCVSSATVDELLPTGLSLQKLLLNIAIFYALILLLYVFTLNWKRSVSIGVILLGILVIINSFIWRFRGRELMFVDFRSMGTALHVAGQYKLHITRMATCVVFVWAMAIFAQTCFPSFRTGRNQRSRILAGLMSAALALAVGFAGYGIKSKTYYNEGTLYNGYCLNFLLGIRDSFVMQPDGYSQEAIRQLEEGYAEASQENREQLPDIIIIMNESFADMKALGSEPRTNIPVTPFWDSLQEDTVRGYALTSVFGGNTANAEFELLTGHSMGFLPDGTVAFQLYIQEPLHSLPWLLKDLGYVNVTTHPYSHTGWSRTTAYPSLGFDESTFDRDYVDPEYLRYYISDQAMVDHMLERMEQQTDAPMLMYAVSMQNHGNYLYQGEDYRQELELEGNYPMAEQYLDIMRYSDKALENLITTLKNRDRDTVVLFFGDHFPHLEKAFYEELHGGPFNTLQEQMLQFKVPFLIWANYDIPEETVDCTSLNYLGRYLLEAAGIELTEYYQFLKDAEQVIPAMNAYGYQSLEQGTFIPYDQARGEEAQWLDRIRILQYNNIFDGENRSRSFFSKHLPER